MKKNNVPLQFMHRLNIEMNYFRWKWFVRKLLCKRQIISKYSTEYIYTKQNKTANRFTVKVKEVISNTTKQSFKEKPTNLSSIFHANNYNKLYTDNQKSDNYVTFSFISSYSHKVTQSFSKVLKHFWPNIVYFSEK